MKDGKGQGGRSLLREEAFLGVSLGTSAFFYFFDAKVLDALENPLWLLLVFALLFGVVMGSALSVVRHADCLAIRLGEPYGTLVLTLSAISIEVLMISAMMLHGENNPTLARDTMFAVLMILLNGMVGLSLLLGGWRHGEQQYNLQGANAYLGVILPLAVLGLMLPGFTTTTSGPTLSPIQEEFLILLSVGLYAVFLAIQTTRHRAFFVSGEEEEGHGQGHAFHLRGTPVHAALLVAYLMPVVFLAEKLAVPLDFGIEILHAPTALGGVVIALLVATPEALSAVKAAMHNRLQRAINILLGSVLSTISLTIPAVLGISLWMDQSIKLGLEHADFLMLALTLAVSVVTFASGRTTILQGAVHLLLFFAYLMLLFEH